MSIYISGALKGSADLSLARQKYELVATVLQRYRARPYLPHQKTDPLRNREVTSTAVYQTDLDAIRRAEAAIIFLDEPSLGVGLEIGLFAEAGIPLLVLCEAGRDPSRFAVGYLEANGHTITVYDGDLDEIVSHWVLNLMGGQRRLA